MGRRRTATCPAAGAGRTRRRTASRRTTTAAVVAAVALVGAGCGSGGSGSTGPDAGATDAAGAGPSSGTDASATAAAGTTPAASSPSSDGGGLAALLAELDAATTTWRTATDLATAQDAARRAATVVAGVAGPGDGDPVGEPTTWLLPTDEGSGGVAVAAADAGGCDATDALGGAWGDPAARWVQLRDVLDRWSPDRNTMPELASHLQRVVGWARLTLGAEDVGEAVAYAGHARLHVDISARALAGC